MHPIFSKHFRQPKGLFGYFIARKMLKMNVVVYDAIEKYAEFERGFKVFEIGYGPGYGVKYFAEKYNLQYHGIDFSKLMHSAAQKKIGNLKSNYLAQLDYGDFLDSNYPAEEYDRIFFANVSYFWESLEIPFAKMFRMLKPNGKLVFYMSERKRLEGNGISNTKHFNQHENDYVESCLKQSGFVGVKLNRILHDQVGRIVVEAAKQ